ncbi:protein argonaute-2-like isoform X2 [Periplaneta americana]|uniref:protein argonaute-2-like isoform X2 n=1 Tax=Periplaneta americana TaxID=6978 RepID=UPI0037E9573C
MEYHLSGKKSGAPSEAQASGGKPEKQTEGRESAQRDVGPGGGPQPGPSQPKQQPQKGQPKQETQAKPEARGDDGAGQQPSEKTEDTSGLSQSQKKKLRKQQQQQQQQQEQPPQQVLQPQPSPLETQAKPEARGGGDGAGQQPREKTEDTSGLSQSQKKKLRKQQQQQQQEQPPQQVLQPQPSPLETQAKPEARGGGDGAGQEPGEKAEDTTGLSQSQKKKLRKQQQQQQQQEQPPQQVLQPQPSPLETQAKPEARGGGDGAGQEPGEKAEDTTGLSQSQKKKLRKQQQQQQQQPQPPHQVLQPQPSPMEVQPDVGPSQQTQQRRKQQQPQAGGDITEFQQKQTQQAPETDLGRGRGRGRGQQRGQTEYKPGMAQEVKSPVSVSQPSGAPVWVRAQSPPQPGGPPPGMGGPRGPPPQTGPPPGMGVPRGQSPQTGPPPGMGVPRGQTPPQVGPQPRMGGPRAQSPQTGPPPGMGVPRGQPLQAAPSPAGRGSPKGQARGAPPPGMSQPQQPARGPAARVSDIQAITKGMQSLIIPRRKSPGTRGRPTVVEVNYLALNISKLRNPIAYHYDVKFEPELPKRLLRPALDEYKIIHFPNRWPAFDGRKNLFSSTELPELYDDEVDVFDPERNATKKFKIAIRYVSQVDLTSLESYMRDGRSVEQPQKALQALDIVLRNAPIAGRFVPVGRSFFTPPQGHVVKLGDGLELWYGIFQSAILGWKPFLNVDVAHKGFPTSQNCVDALLDICRVNPQEELRPREIEDFQKYIRGLKIEYMLPNNPSSKRTYKVNRVVQSPQRQRFELDNGQQTTVLEYFRTVKRVPLRYPNLPCLHVGSPNRPKPIFVPLEFCTVVKGQAINKKMSETSTSAMIKQAATNTDVRKEKIRNALRSVNFNDDPCVREFGLSVGGEFEKVKARVLPPPDLEYRDQQKVKPRSGVWRGASFINSPELKSWIILNLDRYTREDTLWNFAEEMKRAGNSCGMRIGDPLTPRTMPAPVRDTVELEKFLKSVKNEVALVVVVVPDRGDTYAKVKQVAELNIGVLTQCIKATTINRRVNFSTCANILLKVNSKLNGINHKLPSNYRPPCLQGPVMIVGADVTHPSPDQTDIPSIAAVSASHDPVALFKYNIQIRLQPPRVEIIEDLEKIMKAHLLFFYKNTDRQKPQRIIFFRDGVSEGQFQQVLNSELTAIKRACMSLDSEYKPRITFLVVQKRHHTRFFPTRREDEDGRNRNVPPGLVVDEQITHPIELDFFLVSHASIQGVSRPTKYHMLWNDDDNMSTDEIEALTYYLCHMFSRCTRSVSYPAPTYYAHLAAFRARAYIEGRTITMTNLANEQRKYFETAALGNIITSSPMYFV